MTLSGGEKVAAALTSNRSIYYGWWIVAASFVGLALCQSPIAFLTLGVFMKPLGDEFGWGRGAVSLTLSACAIAIAVVTPLAGTLIDRFGARRIMIPSMIGFGLLMASLCLLTNSLPHFYTVFLLLGVVGAGANNVAYMRVISAWFSRNRGLALGIASSGVALGGSAAVLFAQLLIDAYGWRVAYLGLGAAVLFIGVPIVTLIIRDRPVDLAPESAPDEAVEAYRRSATPAGVTVRQAFARPTFWAMVSLGFLMSVALHGVQIHLIPLLTDRGLSAAVAASGFVFAFSVGALIGRMGVGWLFDRYFAPYVGMVAFLLSGVGMLTLIGSPSSWIALVAVFLIGVGSGAESDVLGYLMSRYFGLRSFGQLYGYVFSGFMLGTAAGPYLFGVIFDWTGRYVLALYTGFAFILLMCVVLAVMPRFPEFESAFSKKAGS